MEGERVYLGSRVYRFQWQVKYRRTGETISGEKEWLSKEGSFSKNGAFLFIAVYGGGGGSRIGSAPILSRLYNRAHVQVRETEYQMVFWF